MKIRIKIKIEQLIRLETIRIYIFKVPKKSYLQLRFLRSEILYHETENGEDDSFTM
jgi:hypothetical protein